MKLVEKFSILALCAVATVALTQCKGGNTDETAKERNAILSANLTKGCVERVIKIGEVVDKGLCETEGAIKCELVNNECKPKIDAACVGKTQAECTDSKCFFDTILTPAPGQCINRVAGDKCADFAESPTQCKDFALDATKNKYGCEYDTANKQCKDMGTKCSDLTAKGENACKAAKDSGNCVWTPKPQGEEGEGTCGEKQPDPAAKEVKELALNETHTCFITETKKPTCVPVFVASDTVGETPDAELTNLTAGTDFFCGLDKEAKPVCWGTKASYVDVDNLAKGAKAIGAGPDFVCVIASDDKIVCKGKTAPDIERTGTTKDKTVDKNFSGITWSSMSVGTAHVCGVVKTSEAIDGVTPNAGDIFCFGKNDDKRANPILKDTKPSKMVLAGEATVYLKDGVITAQKDDAIVVAKFKLQGTNTDADVKGNGFFTDLYGSSLSNVVFGLGKDGSAYSSTLDLTGFKPDGVKSIAVGTDKQVCAIDNASKLICMGAEGDIPADYKGTPKA